MVPGAPPSPTEIASAVNPVGAGVAGDEAVSLDTDLAGLIVLEGLIAGNASSHSVCVGHRSCGWPRFLWEPALPAMRPSASISILLA